MLLKAYRMGLVGFGAEGIEPLTRLWDAEITMGQRLVATGLTKPYFLRALRPLAALVGSAVDALSAARHRDRPHDPARSTGDSDRRDPRGAHTDGGRDGHPAGTQLRTREGRGLPSRLYRHDPAGSHAPPISSTPRWNSRHRMNLSLRIPRRWARGRASPWPISASASRFD